MSGPSTGSGMLAAARRRITRTHRLSGSFLGVGFVVIALLLIVRGVVSYLWALDARSATWLTGAAWLLVLLAFAGAVVVAAARHGELPRGASGLVLAVDVVALGLEFADFALPEPAPLYYPSVCVGVAATVIALLPVQPLSRSTGAIVLLIGLSAAGLVGQTLVAGNGAALAVGNVLLAVAPVAVGASLLTTLDRHVDRKLDRSGVDSVIDGPGARLAATELSRVDARIEELLAVVVSSDGRIDDELADRARRLGDDLRAALVRSHDETWLRIAVDESALLSAAVALDDPLGLAAELRPPDRSRLLSVLWLLGASSGPGRAPVELRLSEAAGAAGPESPAPLLIALSAPGVRPRDLDAAVWGILSELGDYRTLSGREGTTLRLRRRLDHRLERRDAS